MPRDYAKNKSRKKKSGASRKKKSRQFPVVLTLLVVVMFSGLVYGLYYIKFSKKDQQTLVQNSQKNRLKKTSQGVQTTAVENSATGSKTQPALEPTTEPPEVIPFYDVHKNLTNKEVKIPAEDLKLPDNINNYYYMMACGSFREKNRAEELKALIALTGNNSELVPVKANGETWYRVQLGPYSRKRKAEGIRHRLEDNNVPGCIINRHLKKTTEKAR